MSKFKVGDRVVILKSGNHIHGLEHGWIDQVDRPGSYQLGVRFGGAKHDYSMFTYQEVEHDKNHIVTSILKDL